MKAQIRFRRFNHHHHHHYIIIIIIMLKVVMLNDFYATGDIYIEDNVLFSKIPTEALIQEQLVSGPRVN